MKKEHTLILFDDFNGSRLFIIEKDLSRFHNVYIGQEGSIIEEELSKILFNDEGKYQLKEIEKPSKDYTWFIKCGNL